MSSIVNRGSPKLNAGTYAYIYYSYDWKVVDGDGNIYDQYCKAVQYIPVDDTAEDIIEYYMICFISDVPNLITNIIRVLNSYCAPCSGKGFAENNKIVLQQAVNQKVEVSYCNIRNYFNSETIV